MKFPTSSQAHREGLGRPSFNPMAHSGVCRTGFPEADFGPNAMNLSPAEAFDPDAPRQEKARRAARASHAGNRDQPEGIAREHFRDRATGRRIGQDAPAPP